MVWYLEARHTKITQELDASPGALVRHYTRTLNVCRRTAFASPLHTSLRTHSIRKTGTRPNQMWQLRASCAFVGTTFGHCEKDISRVQQWQQQHQVMMEYQGACIMHITVSNKRNRTVVREIRAWAGWSTLYTVLQRLNCARENKQTSKHRSWTGIQHWQSTNRTAKLHGIAERFVANELLEKGAVFLVTLHGVYENAESEPGVTRQDGYCTGDRLDDHLHTRNFGTRELGITSYRSGFDTLHCIHSCTVNLLHELLWNRQHANDLQAPTNAAGKTNAT